MVLEAAGGGGDALHDRAQAEAEGQASEAGDLGGVGVEQPPAEEAETGGAGRGYPVRGQGEGRIASDGGMETARSWGKGGRNAGMGRRRAAIPSIQLREGIRIVNKPPRIRCELLELSDLKRL